MKTENEKFDAQGWTGYLNPTYDTPVVRRLLANPREFTRRPGVRVVLKGRNRCVWRVEIPLDGTPMGFYVKRFASRPFWRKVAEFLFRSRAMNSWHVAQALGSAGLPCPEHVAAAERRRWRLLQEAYLVTREVPGGETLCEYLARLDPRRPEGRAHRRALARNLGHLVRDFHKAGFYHADLKLKNILLSGPDSWPHVWLLDTDRTKRANLLTTVVRPFLRFLDLRKLFLSVRSSAEKGRLAISATDQARFFQAYCENHITRRWRTRLYAWAVRLVPKNRRRKRARDRRHAKERQAR